MTDTPPPVETAPVDTRASPPRPAAALSVRLGLGSALFQGALVVLGVVLGFLITEWQADNSRRAEAQQALVSILEEISANRQSVADAHDYHASKITLMDAAYREKTTVDLRAFDRGFVAPAQVSGAAWTTASETGALAHLPFREVLALSRVYAQQTAYQQQQSTVASVIYTGMFDRGSTGIIEHAPGLRSIIAALHYREQQLSEAYANALLEIRPADQAS